MPENAGYTSRLNRDGVAVSLTGLFKFMLFAGLWLALSGGVASSLWFGIPAALAATVLSLWLYPATRPGLRPHRALVFGPSLLARGFLGGLDVARRALDPRLPVGPAWVTLNLKNRPDEFRVLLGGVISVLPGTLAAASSKGELDVHVLQAEGFEIDSLRTEEARIEKVLTAGGGRTE